MPIRDAATTLDDAVGSILAQSFPSYELVAVDDHSSDDTAARLAAWRDVDPRVRPVPVSGSGLIDALNTGLRTARAPLVARMDADDIAHPHRLQLQRAFLRTRSDITVVSCLVECFPRRAVREGYRIYERWLNALTGPDDIAREIYIESPIPHPSAFFRRQAILDAGGYRDRGLPEDYDLWLRLHRSGHRFAKVPEVLLRWRDTPERLSRTDARYSLESFLRTKAHYLATGPLRGRPVHVWGAGPMGRRLGRHLVTEGVEIVAFIDIDPRKIGRTMRRRPIRPPRALPPGEGRSGPGSAGPVVVAAVGSRHARELIRRRVAARFYVEGRDFFCAA